MIAALPVMPPAFKLILPVIAFVIKFNKPGPVDATVFISKFPRVVLNGLLFKSNGLKLLISFCPPLKFQVSCKTPLTKLKILNLPS